ncbi:MAG: hypothetical protein KU37_09390 [Sulfuricurvum sp. PC08-66]|nr:MAG: hypothetical protein KU37_09390 [Sulfuricurvum sp. PC08-66]
MEDISYFDLVFAALILFLGLKGIINGFFKEIFGLIGIIGGIFVGTHYGHTLGKILDEAFLHFENDVAITFTGFIIVLAVFWLGMTYLGVIFTKISQKSGMAPIDRIMGMVLGGGKIFLLFSVIFYTLSNIAVVKSTFDTQLEKSLLYPLFCQTGDLIVQLDPQLMQDKVDQESQQLQEIIDTTVQERITQELESLPSTLSKENNNVAH